MQPLPDVGSAFGAPMGRSNSVTDAAYPVAFEIERLKWVDEAYDQGGAYWGRVDDYIFRAEGESAEDVESIFVRAKNLTEAKKLILATYPNATFLPSADLDSFAAAYIEAALWSSSNDRHEEDPENEPEMLDDAGYDLAEAAEAAMTADCKDFLETHGDLITQALAVGHSIEQSGHDFWLTRNRHGAGFWDRGLGDLGKLLTDAAHAYGESDLYVGDDDKVHVYGEVTTVTPSASGPL